MVDIDANFLPIKKKKKDANFLCTRFLRKEIVVSTGVRHRLALPFMFLFHILFRGVV